jgi:hypothetical protein
MNTGSLSIVIDTPRVNPTINRNPYHSQTSSIHFPLLRYPLSPIHLVCSRFLDPSVLAFSLSLGNTDTPFCVYMSLTSRYITEMYYLNKKKLIQTDL